MITVSVSTDAISDGGQAVRDGVAETLRAAGREGFAESQRRVPVAFGELRNSGDLIERDNEVIFGYDADHAPFVETGTAPHWPPIEPLKEWAALVLGDESAAWAVQQKIADEGTDAQPFMRPGFERAVAELRRRGISPSIEGQL